MSSPSKRLKHAIEEKILFKISRLFQVKTCDQVKNENIAQNFVSIQYIL